MSFVNRIHATCDRNDPWTKLRRFAQLTEFAEGKEKTFLGQFVRNCRAKSGQQDAVHCRNEATVQLAEGIGGPVLGGHDPIRDVIVRVMLQA